MSLKNSIENEVLKSKSFLLMPPEIPNEVRQLIKMFNLDGFKFIHLRYIAECLILILDSNSIPIPRLRRNAKRTIGPLYQWFYENREVLIPWLGSLRFQIVDPLPVTRQPTKQRN